MQGIYVDLEVTKKDLDYYNHANWASYYRYYEEGHRGIFEYAFGVKGYRAFTRKYGFRPLARHLEMDFLGECRRGDKITVYTVIRNIGSTSLTYEQWIKKGRKIVNKAIVISVFTNKKGGKRRIPDHIREKLVEAFPHLMDPD